MTNLVLAIVIEIICDIIVTLIFRFYDKRKNDRHRAKCDH